MLVAGFTHHKRPSLVELYGYLFGEADRLAFESHAHGALADARACARCLLEIRRRGVA
jgi:DNA polymerase III epsilon subunit-like protein